MSATFVHRATCMTSGVTCYHNTAWWRIIADPNILVAPLREAGVPQIPLFHSIPITFYS